MIFTPIASSSAGNAYLVTEGAHSLLLEAGISFKRIQQATNYHAQDLEGCLVTHEHKDHSGHVKKLLENGVRVFASPGTARVLEEPDIVPFQMPEGRNMGPPFRLGPFTVVPFRTFHDAAEPVGYLIAAGGDQLIFATDTVGLAYRFPGVTILAVEANYDDEILSRNTRMPESRIKRVRNSHMEINRLCSWLETLDLSDCRQLWLLHLSDASSNEGRFIDLVERAVGPGITVRAAEKG